MADLRALLAASVCLLVGRQTCAKNDAPCQLSRWKSGYDTFVARHVPAGAPASLDAKEWETYIRDKGCDRPTQSFLRAAELDRVKAVCTTRGGRVYKENLCISRQPFTFVTVRSEVGTCGIRSVREETKHLILACEVLHSQCLPVHFEGNPGNQKPNNNSRGCQEPQSHASRFNATWLWLLSVLLLLIVY